MSAINGFLSTSWQPFTSINEDRIFRMLFSVVTLSRNGQRSQSLWNPSNSWKTKSIMINILHAKMWMNWIHSKNFQWNDGSFMCGTYQLQSGHLIACSVVPFLCFQRFKLLSCSSCLYAMLYIWPETMAKLFVILAMILIIDAHSIKYCDCILHTNTHTHPTPISNPMSNVTTVNANSFYSSPLHFVRSSIFICFTISMYLSIWPTVDCGKSFFLFVVLLQRSHSFHSIFVHFLSGGICSFVFWFQF